MQCNPMKSHFSDEDDGQRESSPLGSSQSSLSSLGSWSLFNPSQDQPDPFDDGLEDVATDTIDDHENANSEGEESLTKILEDGLSDLAFLLL